MLWPNIKKKQTFQASALNKMCIKRNMFTKDDDTNKATTFLRST